MFAHINNSRLKKVRDLDRFADRTLVRNQTDHRVYEEQGMDTPNRKVFMAPKMHYQSTAIGARNGCRPYAVGKKIEFKILTSFNAA